MATAQDTNYTLTARDILEDLKIDFDELFEAKIHESGNGLLLTFNNGQNFLISVKKIIIYSRLFHCVLRFIPIGRNSL